MNRNASDDSSDSISKIKSKNPRKIEEMRLVVSNTCPYSCRYCNLYYKKLFIAGKINKDELLKKYKVGNESFGLLCDDSGGSFLLADYKFLFSTLKNNFGLADITFTGGDPFTNPNLQKIADLAKKNKIRTTAITKGAPLFSCKNKKDILAKLGSIDRIIFSIDTMNKRDYAENNLPLIKLSEGKKFLNRTLKTLKLIASCGYNVEVNSVVKPLPPEKKKQQFIFKDFKKIIDFCLSNMVTKVKFIELDSNDTLGQPFIEDFFITMIDDGYLKKYGVKSYSLKTRKNQKIENNLELFSLTRKRGADMKVYAYRTHCPSTLLDNNKGLKAKRCELNRGGELHLDFQGRSFLCQKDDSFRYVSLLKSVKNRDVKQLELDIIKIDNMIKKQKCKF